MSNYGKTKFLWKIFKAKKHDLLRKNHNYLISRKFEWQFSVYLARVIYLLSLNNFFEILCFGFQIEFQKRNPSDFCFCIIIFQLNSQGHQKTLISYGKSNLFLLTEFSCCNFVLAYKFRFLDLSFKITFFLILNSDQKFF